MTGFYEALPADYATSGKKYPLLIFLHGNSELAGADATTVGAKVTDNGPPRLIRDGQFPASFTVNGQTHSFIVITPQFKGWPGSGEVFLLLKYLKTFYRIDFDRIYVTGLSMGGGVTWGALSENADSAKQIAAAVVVCGAWDPSGVSHLPPRIAANNTPVLATHNDRDGTVPLAYSQGWVNGINNATPATKNPARLTVWASTSHNAWSKTYDPNYKDPETGLNVYEWMLQYTKGGVISNPPPTGNGGKRITVRTTGTNIIYYDNPMTQLGVKPGDTLCIPAGDYEYIHFAKLEGTAEKPIVITNCGGLVRVGVNSSATAASFVFNTSKHIKVEGNGAPSVKYGFDVNGTNKNGQKMFGVFFGSGSTDFEAHHIYIHDAGMFLQAKTLQSCDHPEWLDPVFTMRNVKIHDLLCRNSAWEGFYIGNTHYLWSSGSCTDLASHRIENIQVYNNDLENMGSDGMQISVADKGDNRIYGNRVVNYAMAKNSPHGYGILSGGGSALRIYNNFISKGYNSAIEIFGAGINHVYNNVITDIKFEGINISDKNLFEPATGYIYNNTIINTGVNGIKIYADQTTLGHKVYNNLVVAPGTAWDRPMNGYYIQGSKPVLYDFANNLNFKTIEEAGFQAANIGDYRLKAGSGAIDAGRNMADLGLTADHDGKPRPFNNTFDVGAFEYNNASPSQFTTVTAGNDILISPPTTSVTLRGAASTSNGGTITAFSWNKISGPAQGRIVSPAAATTDVTGLVAGSYVFELKVTNNDGGVATDMITVTVLSAANKPPVSMAGGDVVLTLPANATQLTGSFSIDPDGVIVTYVWEKVSGPAAGSMLDRNASNTDLTGLTAGEYVYRLTVTDNGGLVGYDDVKITVQGASTNKPPVANAGADQTHRIPVGTLALDGSASSDPEGPIATYSWKKLSGPDGGILATPSAAKTNVTSFPTAGEYIFELTVKDGGNVTATDQVKITITAANIPPVANAGSDIIVTYPFNNARLDGSLSMDEDGSLATFSWAKVSGPAAGTISTPDAVATYITDMTPGVYVFRLTVKDNEGATSTAEVTVTVNNANTPPVANAGSDITITLPTTTALLDGTASTDAEGMLSNYQWNQLSGPATALFTSSGVFGKMNATNLLLPGTYVFELTVTDLDSAKAKDQVTVTVNPAPNVVPVARAGNDITITLPTTSAQLNGSASSDEDGSIESYRWAQVSGPATATIAAANASATGLSNLQTVGSYVFELTVTDNSGATAKDRVTVIVNPAANKAPVARAGNDITITLPTTSAQLNGSTSSDEDGSIQSYRWAQLSGPATATISSATASTTGISNLQTAGSYVFELTVTDNSGATAKDQVTVTVNIAPNKAPVARAGNDFAITLPTASAQLDASGSTDEDGQITSYQWRQLSGPVTATIQSATAANSSVDNLGTAGTYVFEITITDNRGATAKAQVTITVNPVPNKAPVARTQGDMRIQAPVDFVLVSGETSTDEDGTIVKWEWKQLSGPSAAVFSRPDKAQGSVTGLVEGVYEMQLSVTDDKQASSVSSFKITVAAAEKDKNDEAYIYPNPASRQFRLNIVHAGQHKAKLKVVDMYGKIHIDRDIQFTDRLQQDIPVENLPNGIYSVHVQGIDNFVFTQKLIKVSF